MTSLHCCYTSSLSLSAGVHIRLQKTLFDKQNHPLKPDVQFLELFAGEVEGKWPLLAASLSLTESEIEQVKREGLPQKDQALQMLKKWVSKEGATYGQLYQQLVTISMFQ